MEGKTELQRNAIRDTRRQELTTTQRFMDMQWLDSRMEDGRMGRLLGLIQREAQMEKEFQEATTMQRFMDMQWLDSQKEDGRMGRLLGLIQREAQMEREFQERTDHAALVNQLAAKEVALGYEIAKVRREEVNELQRRHFIRERDPQLRELMRQLEAGYTCRDIKRQMLDHEYKRLLEKNKEIRENQMIRIALDERRQKEKDALDEIHRKAEYRQELQRQLVDKQRMKQCQYEEALIEKKMLDDIARTVSDEDKRELEQKRMQTEKLQEEMKIFAQAQQAWKEKQKTVAVLEQRQIEEQARLVSDRDAAVIAERKRILQAREETNKIICAKIKAAEDERLHRQDLITLLQQQEYIETNINNDYSDKEKMARTKHDIKEALNAQMNARKQLEEDQKARDLELRRETVAKEAEENMREAEKNRLRREKNRMYAAELLKQAEVQRSKRDAVKQDDQLRAKAMKDYQSAWDDEVAKERRVIIQEHAPHVIGYLQAGVLKKDDLSDVRIGANRHKDLAKLDFESMASARHPKLHSKCNEQCRVLRKY